MSGIDIAALLTAGIALAVYGGILLRHARPDERALLVFCLAIELPMNPLAFHLVREPLDALIRPAIGGSDFYWWGRVLYAPLTEEPAKLIALLVPWIRRRIDAGNATRVAMALGLGFGLGEIELVASFVRSSPALGELQWHAFGGFIVERLQVCLIHGLFTAMVLLAWRRWRWGFLAGLALAMALHGLANLPILLAARGWLGGPALQAIMLSAWVAAFWIAAGWLLLVRDPRIAGIPLPGRPIVCRHCGTAFQRRLLAVNLGFRRLERCPNCARWSLL